MRRDHLLVMSLLVAAMTLGGCATNRSELLIGSGPSPQTRPINANAPTAVIRSVKDERIFEQAPRQANIPSLGFEGATQATAETKLRAIGRKRNGYGMALGDVLLQDGQTVESVVRENLASALQDAGYNVRSGDTANTAALVIDVRIKEFWAWIHPGFWAITVNTDIATDLTLSTMSNSIPVVVHVKDPKMFVTDSAWIEAIDKGLEAFRHEAARKLPAAK
jgi:hypothetical protein